MFSVGGAAWLCAIAYAMLVLTHRIGSTATLLASLLAWRGWGRLAPATFGAYLIHPICIVLSYRQVLPLTAAPSDALLVVLIAGNLAVAFAFGFAVHFLVEAPMTRWLRPPKPDFRKKGD